jgi:hypothetical protein
LCALAGELLVQRDQQLCSFKQYEAKLSLGEPESVGLSDAGFRDVSEAIHPTQATLGREVKPKVFALDEFAAKARSNPFLRDVLSRSKIFLSEMPMSLKNLLGASLSASQPGADSAVAVRSLATAGVAARFRG